MIEGEARFPGGTPLIRALTMQRSIRSLSRGSADRRLFVHGGQVRRPSIGTIRIFVGIAVSFPRLKVATGVRPNHRQTRQERTGCSSMAASFGRLTDNEPARAPIVKREMQSSDCIRGVEYGVLPTSNIVKFLTEFSDQRERVLAWVR